MEDVVTILVGAEVLVLNRFEDLLRRREELKKRIGDEAKEREKAREPEDQYARHETQREPGR